MIDKQSRILSCALPSAELTQIKETVIHNMVGKIVARKELNNGYSYKFGGGDLIIDELSEFVKTERACCSFFSFHLSFSGHQKGAGLKITGPPGAKAFIRAELGM